MVKYSCIEETKSYWYAWNVVEKNIVANVDVANACRRFMKDLERQKDDDYPFYFDLSQASRIENAAGCLKFTGGARAGQFIDLAPPQTFVMDNLYCWRYKANPRKRRIRSSFLMEARKNAKTFKLAMLSILAMLDEEEAEIYSVASKKDQARLSFKQCRAMIGSNVNLKKKFKLNRAEIRLIKNESTFQYLASEEKTLDGTSVSVGIIDEAFVVPEGVRSSISSGTGARLSPLIVGISTSYDVKMTGNWAYDEMQYTKDVNSGKLENERHFGLIYQLDSEDEVSNEAMWEKANPLIPYSPTLLEDLQEAYKKAKGNLALLRNFKIKNMNLIMDGNSINKYLILPAWEGSTADDFIDLDGKWVFYGLDLSITTDLCAVSKMTYDEESDEYLLKVHAFLPRSKIEELEVRDGIKYREYEGEHITLIDGDVIEQEVVFQWIKSDIDFDGSQLAMIAYDPYNSDYILNRCKEEGIPTLAIKQGYNMLSGVTKLFREYVYKRKIKHEHNPIMNWCVSNAITTKDKFNNEILDKIKSVEKIDLLAASIFAFLPCYKNKENFFNKNYEDNIV